MVLVSTYNPFLIILSILGLTITYREWDNIFGSTVSKRQTISRVLVLNAPLILLLNIWIRDF